MNNPEIWITPLALLPGVALLILSTSTRFGQLHTEIHHLQHEDEEIPDHLITRAKLFKNSLVLLYAGVVFFSLSAFFGGISELGGGVFYWIIIALLCFGIICIIFSSFLLLKESTLSFKIIEHHSK